VIKRRAETRRARTWLKRVATLLALVIALSVIVLIFARAGASLATGIGWTSATTVSRDAEYRRIIDGFDNAMPLPKSTIDSLRNPGWNQDLAVTSAVSVHLRAGEHLDVARLRYSDEAVPREAFKYADYTNIGDVRRSGDMLYILRSITLFRVEYRLTAYDLRNRAVLADRRVSPSDLH